MIGSRSRVILTAASAVLVGVVAVGCKSKGEVKSRTQDQEVRPDGTAVQTRSQIRETSGGTVKETQTQTRQPISGSGTGTGATTRPTTRPSGTRSGSGTGTGY